MRRLLLVVLPIVFLDVAFYQAIIPLLPDYARDLDLNKAEAGVLTASFAAGTLLASLPAGLVAARVGPRRTLVVGLLLLGLSSLAFGLAGEIVLLDGARFVQGISGALTWAGALTWLITTAPQSRRGGVIGTALGAAIAGALLGPLLGALATAVGTEVVFGSVLAIALALAFAALQIPDVTALERDTLRGVLSTLVNGRVVATAALVAAPSLMFGAISVLVPLRMDELGGGPALIAVGFMVGAGLEAVLSPTVGRYSDRAGPLAPYLAGLVICATAIAAVAVGARVSVIFTAILGTSVGAGLAFAPATTMLVDSAQASGLHQGLAAGLTNMAWAAGQVAGAGGGGAAASALGNATPCLVIAVLLVGTALLARRAATTLVARPAVAAE